MYISVSVNCNPKGREGKNEVEGGQVLFTGVSIDLFRLVTEVEVVVVVMVHKIEVSEGCEGTHTLRP